jgi:hypothetical protein
MVSLLGWINYKSQYEDQSSRVQLFAIQTGRKIINQTQRTQSIILSFILCALVYG